ncbi:MAG: hypothetical protein QOK30_2388 [Nocardioidaceae bacterium]|jgi:hypothetical protein|nr:hypothetical protein [Nocardioidaceae bacterium]
MDLTLVRRVGAALLAVAVVTVWFSMKPHLTQPVHFSAELSAAVADGRTNAANDTNVYQQQVSNGWKANDLLEILVRQQDADARLGAPSDRRIPAELMLLTLGLALLIGTSTASRRNGDSDPGMHEGSASWAAPPGRPGWITPPTTPVARGYPSGPAHPAGPVSHPPPAPGPPPYDQPSSSVDQGGSL